MNPILEQRIKELERQITELREVAHVGFIENGKRRIVEPVLGDIVRRDSVGNTTGMTRSVNEGGTGTYNVAKAFDTSIIVTDANGVRYKLGVYNI